MRSVRKFLVPLLCFTSVCLGGCYRTTYHIADSTEHTYAMTAWDHYFFLGLVPVLESRDLEKLCPGSKILEVKTYTSAANLVSVVLSGGMSSGRTMEYTCTFPEGRLLRSAEKLKDSIFGRLRIGKHGSSGKQPEE